MLRIRPLLLVLASCLLLNLTATELKAQSFSHHGCYVGQQQNQPWQWPTQCETCANGLLNGPCNNCAPTEYRLETRTRMINVTRYMRVQILVPQVDSFGRPVFGANGRRLMCIKTIRRPVTERVQQTYQVQVPVTPTRRTVIVSAPSDPDDAYDIKGLIRDILENPSRKLTRPEAELLIDRFIDQNQP